MKEIGKESKGGNKSETKGKGEKREREGEEWKHYTTKACQLDKPESRSAAQEVHGLTYEYLEFSLDLFKGQMKSQGEGKPEGAGNFSIQG